jgi:hypothetical protein
MHLPPVLLNCTPLTDDELEDFRNFLKSQAPVETVVVGHMAMFEESSPPDRAIRIQAAAAPLLLAVHFARAHWSALGAGIVGTAKSVDWVSKRVKEWSAGRKEKYDYKPLYDGNDKVIKLVKIRKGS